MDNLNPLVLIGAIVAGLLIDLSAGTRVASSVAAAGVATVLGVTAVRRGRERRAFAAEHGLTYRMIQPSDARPPFTRFAGVKSAVLLFSLAEGPWAGVDVWVFNLRARPGRGTWAIITHPTGADAPEPSAGGHPIGDQARFPGSRYVEGAGPYRLFFAGRLVPARDLKPWLTHAVAVTRAQS